MALVEELQSTITLYVAIVILSVILIVAYLFMTGIRGSIGYRIEFVHIFGLPYKVSGVLSSYVADDKNILEHAIEASFYGSFDQANSPNFKSSVKNFLDKYKLDYYSVNLFKAGKSVEGFDNLPHKCGNSLEGFCVNNLDADAGGGGPCGVNRIRIDEGKNGCSLNSVCCQETDPSTYHSAGETFEVVYCGTADLGICTYGYHQTLCSGQDCNTIFYDCSDGRTKLEDTVCENVNQGKTPKCCAPLDPEVKKLLGLASTSVIPLFYKDSYGELQVTVGK